MAQDVVEAAHYMDFDSFAPDLKLPSAIYFLSLYGRIVCLNYLLITLCSLTCLFFLVLYGTLEMMCRGSRLVMCEVLYKGKEKNSFKK